MVIEQPPIVDVLVLLKVRGQPAFDIAERLEMEDGDEEWWIIPTSGHRAYPVDWWELEYLFDGSDYPRQLYAGAS